MAYNKENLLRKKIEIQDIVLKYKAIGVPQKRIYQDHIKGQYHISYSCFNDYLAAPAKMELAKLLAEKERKKEMGKTQTELFTEDKN